MNHYKYVTKKEAKAKKKEIIQLINLVQKEVHNDFTFHYEFVGSAKRNMVTYDPQSNIGYDFDIDIAVNVKKDEYTAKEIKHKLMYAFNKYAKNYHYDFCEDSTRVLTIKVKDIKNSKILYSCDFAIVRNGTKQYIHFNKKENVYTWESQPNEFANLSKEIKYCKENRLWQKVKTLYLQKKNTNTDIHKKSRSIFAETIHQIYQQNQH